MMFTVIETPTFQKQVAKVWTQDDRHEFINWISRNPLAGDTIPGADGARKVRWAAQGKGKRAGARVVYFNLHEQEIVLLVAVYTKGVKTNISSNEIERN